jgi:hypothetical protein
MASRKLNLKQLVTLAEVYWDDPAKLKEILEALRERLEPNAEALQRMVEQRMETLKNNPADKSPPPAGISSSSSPEAAPPPDEIDSGRRKWPAVVILALLLAAILTWMFWPVDEVPQTATATEQGPEVQDLNEVPADKKPPGQSSSAPPTAPRRVTIEPSSADRDPAGKTRDVETRQRSLMPTASHPHEVKDPREAAVRETPAADVPAAKDGARARSEAVASAAAMGSSSRAIAARGPASRGVATSGAQLDCYLTDNRPGSCGAASPSSGGAGGRSRPAPSAGADSNPPPPASARAAPAPAPANSSAGAGGAPAARPSPASEQTAASAAAGAASSSRSGGGASSGSGADENAGGASASSSRRTPGAAASAGEEKDKANPPPSGEEPPSSQAPGEMPPPPDCPDAPETDRVVFILDGSVSMALPLNVDAAVEDELDARILHHDQVARQQYRELLAQAGPKRITRAQDAFAAAVNDLPQAVELGLMVFQECRDIRQVGIYEAARRGAAVAYVRNLIPRGRTPLADSLKRAAGMLGEGRSSIVLLTDGREFCGGDPCAAAAALKADHPDTPVHVVDITGQAKAECIADVTGGKSYKPEATEDLARILRNAFRGADPSCGIPSPAAADP